MGSKITDCFVINKTFGQYFFYSSKYFIPKQPHSSGSHPPLLYNLMLRFRGNTFSAPANRYVSFLATFLIFPTHKFHDLPFTSGYNDNHTGSRQSAVPDFFIYSTSFQHSPIKICFSYRDKISLFQQGCPRHVIFKF